MPPDVVNSDGSEAKVAGPTLAGLDKARYVWRGGLSVTVRQLNLMLPAVPSAGAWVVGGIGYSWE